MATEASAWTGTAELRAASLKSWDRGDVLRELLEPTGVYPRRRSLKSPSAGELRQRFSEAREWVGALRAGAKHFRVESRSIGHQSIGANDVPVAVWFDSVRDEIAFIGKGREAAALLQLAVELQGVEPDIRPWILARPLQLLELGAEAMVAVKVARWLVENNDSGMYVRQLALEGVHTKFVEKNVRTIEDMAAALIGIAPPRSSSMRSFRQRHGFNLEPEMVRIRGLDSILGAPGGAEDMEIPAAAFERMAPRVKTVLVTENKTNFLALPLQPETLVVFGGGYGFAGLRAAHWVGQCDVVYWGDLDTHGFAILSQLRSHHPHVRSVLMDVQTLLDHRGFWGIEATPARAVPGHLTEAEAELCAALVAGAHGHNLRLEQEQVNWDYALERIGPACGWGSVS